MHIHHQFIFEQEISVFIYFSVEIHHRREMFLHLMRFAL